MKRHERTFNAYSDVREARMKRLRTLWPQRHDTLGRLKLWRQWRDQWLQGWVEVRNRQSTEDFQGRETTLHDTMMDMSHYTSAQPTEHLTPRLNYNVSRLITGLWATVSVGSVVVTNLPPGGGRWQCWGGGAGSMENLCSFPLILQGT